MALSGTISGSIYSGHYKLELRWSATQNVANNTSTITVKMYMINDYNISISGRTNSITIAGSSTSIKSSSISSKGKHYIGSVSKTITHNADGKKQVSISGAFNIQATLNGTYYSAISASQTVTLNTIPRASSISWGSGTSSIIGVANGTTINIKRASSSFTHTLRYVFGNKSGTIVSKTTSTSVKWTIPLNFADEIPNSASGSGTIYCDTYSGSTKIGTTSLSMTGTVPDSMKPTLNNFTIAMVNDNSVIKDWGVAVAGFTKVRLTAGATAQHSATIKSFTLSNSVATTQNVGSLDYTSGVITKSGNLSFTCSAKDSRAKSSNSSTQQMTFLAYSEPSINTFTVKRSSINAKLIDVVINYTFASVSNHNTASAILKYKKANETNWATYPTPITNGSTVTLADLELAEEYSYNLQLVVTDALGKTDVVEAFLSTIDVLMDFRDGGKGIGIGKISEKDGLEIDMPTYFTDDQIFIGNLTLKQYIKQAINS